MTAPQNAKVNMFRTVTKQLSEVPDALKTVVAIKRNADIFAAKVAAITAIVPKQQEGSTGETNTKAQARSIVETLYDELTDQVYSWAAENNDEQAKAKADLTLSDIEAFNTLDLSTNAEAFYEFAAAHKAGLADFGVTDEQLAEFAEAIDNFNDAAELPRNKISQRVTSTGNLAAMIADADKFLNERLKTSMVALRRTFPDVYATFLNNCKIVDPRSASAKKKAANKAAKAAKSKDAGGTA